MTTIAMGSDRRRPVVNRWIQLIAAIIAMLAISNLQYAWTLFTGPLRTSLHATLPTIQIAFSTFILAETWLVPFEGAIIDWLGPSLMQIIGGVLVGIGWVGAGKATSVTQLIIVYTIGGMGAGAVYGGSRRQCSEMVSRSARAMRRFDRWCLWHRHRVDSAPDRQDDQICRLCSYVGSLGNYSGNHCYRDWSCPP